MGGEMSSWTLRRIITVLFGRNHSAVPSKISQMELAAYDAVAYDNNSDGGLSIDSSSMDTNVTENTLTLNKPAYIAGDTITGTVNIRSSRTLELMCMRLELVGYGMAFYHKTNYRMQRFCEIETPSMSVKEHCVEAGKVWSIPFSLRLDDKLISSIDGGKKGRVCYYISWELKGNVGDLSRKHEEITILANHTLDSLPRNREMSGNNTEEEEYDHMKLQLYSPASAYLPGEIIIFRSYIENLAKKTIKKVAVLLIQNVLFYKNKCDDDTKGRTRSFLMSVKEKPLRLKQNEIDEWTDEIQIPDPVAPSADGFHKINYELVLVAIIKGAKSNIRAIFDQARFHFDLERYQDDYFRDFLPHATCDLEIGSHHGSKRSIYMSTGAQPVRALNDKWKQKTKDKTQQRKLPRPVSQGTMARITFDPNTN